MRRACRSISSNSSAKTSREMGRSRISDENVAGEGLVIGDARLPHQGGIGGEPLYERIAIQLQHRRLVGAIGEEFDAQIGEIHGYWLHICRVRGGYSS